MLCYDKPNSKVYAIGHGYMYILVKVYHDMPTISYHVTLQRNKACPGPGMQHDRYASKKWPDRGSTKLKTKGRHQRSFFPSAFSFPSSSDWSSLIATMTYATKTTLAMIAAVAPAKVELPVHCSLN